MMDHSSIAWHSYPPSYRAMLDKGQNKVKRLCHTIICELQPLQQQYMAGLCVTYKATIQKVSYLAQLQLVLVPRVYSAQGVTNKPKCLIIIFAITDCLLYTTFGCSRSSVENSWTAW